MFASTTALFTRSLREDSRVLRAHLLRFFLVGIILWSLVTAHQASAWRGAPGLQFFESITYLNFIFITLAGISFFATAITEEKEEMTLGLLRMAGISPLSLLLGKSTPRLITAVLLLSVQFPFTLLAITLGGVTFPQVFASYCALFAYMVFLGNLGLFCSVFCSRSSAASWMTGIFLAGVLLGPLIAKEFITEWIATGAISRTAITPQLALIGFDWLIAANPFSRIDVIMATGFAESPVGYQVISNVVTAMAFFILSWLTFDRFVGQQITASPARGLLSIRRVRLRFFSTSRTWKNALMWKDFHFIAGGKILMIIKFVIYGALGPVLYGSTRWPRRGFDPEELSGWIMGTMLVAMILEMAMYSARVFHDESKWRTLSSVMMLPKSTAGIAYSKIAGCLIALLPAVFVFLVGVLIHPDNLADVLEDLIDEPGAWFVVIQYILFLHMVAFLSLIVKWGALPLAFALVYVVNGFCMVSMTMGPGSGGDGIFVLMSFLGLCGTFALHLGVGECLRSAATKQ